MQGRGRDHGVDAAALGELHGFRTAVDVLGIGARQAGDDGVLGAAGDFAHRLEVAFRGDGKAGLDDVDAHVVEHLGDHDLFLEGHGRAGALLAVTQGGVEYDDAVLLGLVGGVHLCSSFWVVRRSEGAEGFSQLTRTPECPGANRPDGPQGPIRSRSPPRSRVGRDAAGIAGVAAKAAPPKIPEFSLRISIAKPLKPGNPRPKPLTVRCRRPRARPFLDEKCQSLQCQKMVSRGDVFGEGPGGLTPQRCRPPRKRGTRYAAAYRFNHRGLWNTGSPGQAGRRQLCVGEHAFSFSRHDFRPSYSNSLSLCEQRAQGKPGADCARSTACKKTNTHTDWTGTAETSRLSPRNGFTAYTCSPR